MTIFRLGTTSPEIPESAFVAPGACVIGRVTLGAESSVWFGAVLRGDNEPIHIGAGSNVQEGAVLHADQGFPLHVGDHVTVGHQAMLHGCSIGDGSLVGIEAVVMNGARIGRHFIVGAGAIVTEGKSLPDRSLILGAPAKLARELSDNEVAKLDDSAATYVTHGRRYPRELERLS